MSIPNVIRIAFLALVIGIVIGFTYAAYNAVLVANTDTGYMISYAGVTHYYDK